MKGSTPPTNLQFQSKPFVLFLFLDEWVGQKRTVFNVFFIFELVNIVILHM